MGEAEFVREMEKLFEDHPMQKESFEKVLLYEISSVEFYSSRGSESPGASMTNLGRGVNWIWMNISHPEYKMDESFAHEVAHIYYMKRISRIFNKHIRALYQDSWTGTSNACEEDLIEWSAVRFCRENPGYVSGVLSDIILGNGYRHIRITYR